MRKSEVFSWRLEPHTKAALEAQARREGSSVAELLDRLVERWIEERRAQAGDDEEDQVRLRAAAERAIGSVKGRDPRRSRRVREGVRGRLVRRRAR